jgi:nucleoid-associated protein YgaU
MLAGRVSKEESGTPDKRRFCVAVKNWSHNLKRGYRITLHLKDETPPPAPPSTPISAPSVAPALANSPEHYLVTKGDCLAKIAERRYGKQVWSKIFDANRAIINDPDLIFPGQELVLP